MTLTRLITAAPALVLLPFLLALPVMAFREARRSRREEVAAERAARPHSTDLDAADEDAAAAPTDRPADEHDSD